MTSFNPNGFRDPVRAVVPPLSTVKGVRFRDLGKSAVLIFTDGRHSCGGEPLQA